MAFLLFYHPDVLKDDAKLLNKNILQRIKQAIENRLGTAPLDYGKPLRGNLKSIWSLRVGDYRVLYRIQGLQVLVLQVVNRRDAYHEGLLEMRSKTIF